MNLRSASRLLAWTSITLGPVLSLIGYTPPLIHHMLSTYPEGYLVLMDLESIINGSLGSILLGAIVLLLLRIESHMASSGQF
jgi:hypothetical protein